MTDRAAFLKQIAETFRSARDRDKPAHLLIGAGCSKSAGVPLAGELVAEIRKRYPERCEPKFLSGSATYGDCMKLLSVGERRNLLETYLRKAKINWAHIVIAKLIFDGIV